MNDVQFTALVRRHLKYLTADAELDDDRPLRTMGLDSMSAVNLLLDIEDTYGVTFSDEHLTEAAFATARSLWTVVRALVHVAGQRGDRYVGG